MIFIHELYEKMGIHRICQKYGDISEKIVKTMFLFFSLICILSTIYIMILPLLLGDLNIVIPILIPGVNTNTLVGFQITVGFQMILLIFAVLIFHPFDALIVVIISNMLMVSSVIVEQLNKLEELFTDNEIVTNKILLHISDVIILHNQYNEWV